ncbi:gephyrin-like molybdotransferase Glp [Luteimonas arsenica]|uniref:molybdopterin molybdotransferase MoeA n=1 Tax=Luteimonas arsenica TaxID=1586242 RepID=UPI0010544616|nr:gephyrin-like molybdotransferase Glp [Luteimonas arsenica]
MSGQAVSCKEALSIVLREAAPFAIDYRPLAEAAGLVLAEAVVADVDLPPFDNSAMDGFALRAEGRTVAAGTEFDVAGAQVAGDEATAAGEGGAWEIMTGARMPAGLDSVVPVERIEVIGRDDAGRPSRIRLTADVKPGDNVRLRGQDVESGTTVLRAGTVVDSAAVMVLSSLGVDRVAVRRRPKVAVLNTGRELVDDPRRPLASGEIRNSNGPFLAARVAAAGAELVLRETVTDEPADFLAALERTLAAGADVVLSTGAVSMGRHDFVPDALRSIGADIRFHKVEIRPGRPLLFARLAGGQLYFGLPGNPASAAVGLRFFAEAALRAFTGQAPERPLRMPLAADWSKRAALRFHLKGRVELAGGVLRARILHGQESFKVQPLLVANAWIVLPEDTMQFQAGDMVDVYAPGHAEGLKIEEVVQ